MSTTDQSIYTVQMRVQAPARQRRWTVLLRIPLSIPALIFSVMIQSGIALAIWSAILVRGQIPDWLFNFHVAVNRWHIRTAAYLLLLSDRYPPFEGSYPVEYAIDDVNHRSRWKIIIWKLVTAIPHFLILIPLGLTLLAAVPVAWIAVLLTGQMPVFLHRHITGVVRWAARVQAYVLSLTDSYPPFRRSEDAAAASRNSYLAASTAGVLISVGLISVFSALVAFGGQQVEATVPYDQLLAGELRSPGVHTQIIVADVWLTTATDPVDSLEPYITAEAGNRLVSLDLTISQRSGSVNPVPIKPSSFSLQDENGKRYTPLLVSVDGKAGSTQIGRGMSGVVRVVFEMPASSVPVAFRFDALNYIDFPRVGETVIYRLD